MTWAQRGEVWEAESVGIPAVLAEGWSREERDLTHWRGQPHGQWCRSLRWEDRQMNEATFPGGRRQIEGSLGRVTREARFRCPSGDVGSQMGPRFPLVVRDTNLGVIGI